MVGDEAPLAEPTSGGAGDIFGDPALRACSTLKNRRNEAGYLIRQGGERGHQRLAFGRAGDLPQQDDVCPQVRLVLRERHQPSVVKKVAVVVPVPVPDTLSRKILIPLMSLRKMPSAVMLVAIVVDPTGTTPIVM